MAKTNDRSAPMATAPGEIAHEHLLKPDEYEGKAAGFNVTITYDKAADATAKPYADVDAKLPSLAEFSQKIHAFAQSIWPGVEKGGYESIVKDGDKMIYRKGEKAGQKKDQYAGKWVLRLDSRYAPRMANPDGSEFSSADEVWAGDILAAGIVLVPKEEDVVVNVQREDGTIVEQVKHVRRLRAFLNEGKLVAKGPRSSRGDGESGPPPSMFITKPADEVVAVMDDEPAAAQVDDDSCPF